MLKYKGLKKTAESERDYTNEQVDEQIFNTTQLSANIVEEWGKLVARHEEYLKAYQIEFDENDDVILKDEDASGRETWQDATKIDNFRKTNSAIKMLLATIPVTLENGFIDRSLSSIGGVTLLPVSKTYITLMNNLYSSSDVEEMVGRLRELAEKDRNYRTLYSRITKKDYSEKGVDLSQITTEHGAQLLSSFWRTFKKQNPDVKNVFILENGDVVIGEANLSTAARMLKNDYVNGIVIKARANEGFFKYDPKEKLFVGDPNKLGNFKDLSKPQVMVKFLDDMGIPFTMSEYNKLSNKQKNDFKEAVLGIRKSIAESQKIVTFSGKSLNMDNRLLEIALLKTAVSTPEMSSTYFNVVGERVQSYVGTNAGSNFSTFLSKLKNFDEASIGSTEFRYLIKDSFAKNSNLLSRMFTSKGSRKQGTEDLFEIGYVSGVVDEEKGKRKESSRLTYPQRLIQEINLNLKGIYLNLVPGDASIEWTIKMGNPISIETLNKGMDQVYKIFEGYFTSELELARENRSVAKDRQGNKLRFFSAILGEQLEKDVLEAKGTPEEIYKKFEDR
jgi:hypothetical protein